MTGIRNQNFVDRLAEGVEDGEYEEVEGEETLEKGDRNPSGTGREGQHQSSVTFGISSGKPKKDHSYVNVEEGEGKQEDVMCAAGEDGKTGNSDEKKEHMDKARTEDINRERDETAGESRRRDREETESPEKSLEWDENIEWNNTIISDVFAQNVREAIEQVDAEQIEGEERIAKVLETLEQGMQAESEEVIVRKPRAGRKPREDVTPRRSERIAELKDSEKEKK